VQDKTTRMGKYNLSVALKRYISFMHDMSAV